MPPPRFGCRSPRAPTTSPAPVPPRPSRDRSHCRSRSTAPNPPLRVRGAVNRSLHGPVRSSRAVNRSSRAIFRRNRAVNRCPEPWRVPSRSGQPLCLPLPASERAVNRSRSRRHPFGEQLTARFLLRRPREERSTAPRTSQAGASGRSNAPSLAHSRSDAAGRFLTFGRFSASVWL